MSSPVEFDQVSFSYGTTPILTNVNFSLSAGEYIGIIGPNGGGKTTLFKLILGFLTPVMGRVSIFGQPAERMQSSIGYVPQVLQFDRLFPISVLELVLTGRLAHLPWYGQFSSTEIENALEMIEIVGLGGFAQHPIGTLSGGQVQRALIARAMVSQPQVLLLDEPTANVDPDAQTMIYELLESLKGKMTILMVTHDLHAALHHVERILCVHNTLLTLKPDQVCEHFTVGLYHSKIVEEKES